VSLFLHSPPPPTPNLFCLSFPACFFSRYQFKPGGGGVGGGFCFLGFGVFFFFWGFGVGGGGGGLLSFCVFFVGGLFFLGWGVGGVFFSLS